MKEVGRYTWGATRGEQLQKNVYGAFMNLGYSVLRLGEGLPQLLVAKDGYTAVVMVPVLDRSGHFGNKRHAASVRAFLSLWQGHVFDVATQEDVIYAANRMDLMGRAAALGAEPCTPPAKPPSA